MLLLVVAAGFEPFSVVVPVDVVLEAASVVTEVVLASAEMEGAVLASGA